jgi:hypothetical protein
VAKAKATRRRTTVIREDLPAAGNDEIKLSDAVPDADDDSELDVIEKLRGMGSGSGYTCAVYRIRVNPGEKQGYCRTFNMADISPETIREIYGGGTYRLKVKDSNGKFVHGGSEVIEIIDEPKVGVVMPAGQPAPMETLDGIAKIAAMFKPGTSDGGMAAMIPLILGMMDSQSKLFASMMNRPRDELKIADIIALVKSSGEGSDPVKLLLQGLELGKGLGGGGETGWMDIGKSALEAIGPMLAQQREANGLPAHDTTTRQRPALPAPKPGEAPAQPRGEGDVGLIQKLNWLKQQVNILIHHAARNKNPELYAEVMLDNLPPFITEDEILQRMHEPDAVATLATLDGRVANHAAWFEAFRLAVIASIEDDGEDDGEGEGGGEGEPAGSGE